MLRTMVLVFIPALFVHGVLTLGDDLITLHERSLTEVTGLCHHLAPETHLVASIDVNILAFEDPITDIGLQ